MFYQPFDMSAVAVHMARIQWVDNQWWACFAVHMAMYEMKSISYVRNELSSSLSMSLMRSIVVWTGLSYNKDTINNKSEACFFVVHEPHDFHELCVPIVLIKWVWIISLLGLSLWALQHELCRREHGSNKTNSQPMMSLLHSHSWTLIYKRPCTRWVQLKHLTNVNELNMSSVVVHMAVSKWFLNQTWACIIIVY